MAGGELAVPHRLLKRPVDLCRPDVRGQLLGFLRELCSQGSDPTASERPGDLGLRLSSAPGDGVDGAREANGDLVEQLAFAALGLGLFSRERCFGPRQLFAGSIAQASDVVPRPTDRWARAHPVTGRAG